jgi:hypothetical protein
VRTILNLKISANFVLQTVQSRAKPYLSWSSIWEKSAWRACVAVLGAATSPTPALTGGPRHHMLSRTVVREFQICVTDLANERQLYIRLTAPTPPKPSTSLFHFLLASARDPGMQAPGMFSETQPHVCEARSTRVTRGFRSI